MVMFLKSKVFFVFEILKLSKIKVVEMMAHQLYKIFILEM